MKIGVNASCPCGSGRKYKKCCLGKVEWEKLSHSSLSAVAPYLSLRGKNLAFIDALADALLLDKTELPADYPSFKRAFTPAAVRKISMAVADVWPGGKDLDRILQAERPSTAGLYVGTMEPGQLTQGIVRHTLYSDRLLVPDPFMDPRRVTPRFNPLEHPEMHRSSVLRWTVLWLELSPWIEAGLVGFIRTPGDFDPVLDRESMRVSRARFDAHPELAEALEAVDPEVAMESYNRQMKLGTPDAVIRHQAKRANPSWGEAEIDEFLAYVQYQRDVDPYFIEPLQAGNGGELLHISSGANYEMAKLTAARADAFLVTDLTPRWLEMKIDRSQNATVEQWSPFAKAFSEVDFPFLENVPLESALSIRTDGHLAGMRDFMRRVWRAAAPGEPYSEGAAESLAAELREKLNEASLEWNVINRDLVRNAGGAVVAAMGSVPVVGTAQAEWVWGAVAAAGALNLFLTGSKRKDHAIKYPAGFLLKLERKARRAS